MQSKKQRKSALASAVSAVVLCAISDEGEYHSKCIKRHRMNWDFHIQTLLLEGQFSQYYQMSYAAFEELCSFIAPAISVHEIKSKIKQDYTLCQFKSAYK